MPAAVADAGVKTDVAITSDVAESATPKIRWFAGAVLVIAPGVADT